MQKPAIEKVLPQDFKIEIPEVKKSLPLRRIDEELSEFERARRQQDVVHGTRLDRCGLSLRPGLRPGHRSTDL